ncbi:hypothetical protein [Thauera sp.]|uniref:hypothetical protein n=1 Tax=Thauera sp. TaxID=1905334 RepID=UPI0039E22B6C
MRNVTLRAFTFLASVAAGLIMPQMAMADVVDLARTPLTNAATTEVKPNLMFILDDSGSMDWEFMPDLVTDGSYCKGTSSAGTNYRCCREATGTQGGTARGDGEACQPTSLTAHRGMPPFYASGFNKSYYDPTVTYRPPQTYDGNEATDYGGTDSVPLDGYGIQRTDTLNLTGNYPDVEWCTDSGYSDCLRNGDYILPGVVGGKSYTWLRAARATGGTARFAVGPVDSPSIEQRPTGPFYYVMLPAEYCTDNNLVDCVEAGAPTATHRVPAKLRWCRNANLTDCRATQNATYNYPRYPTVVTSSAVSAVPSSTGVFGVSGVSRSNATGAGSVCNGKTNVVTVNSIRVGGIELLSESLKYCNASNDANTRNRGLADAIADRISNGFSAARSGTANMVVTAPDGSYNGQSLVASMLGASWANSARMSFSGGVAASAMAFVPGTFTRIDIVPGVTYGNILNAEGSILLDRGQRSDCVAAPNCTYAEELRNFANWFAWYRTRMQAMKTSVSRTFVTIDSTYRVGFRSLNNNNSVNLKIANFTGSHKADWYGKLFDARPTGGTPLRRALSDVGRIYAGKGSGTTGADPVQYSCQQNFALLTSDGYWNGNGGGNLAGSAIGNEDGSGTPRPYYEGPTASSGSLADVAKYYYETDLRTSALGNCAGALSGENVCTNNVFTSGEDNNSKQHMTTFTLGLGVDGELRYQSDYKTAESGDYYNILKGLGTPQANWPVPQADKPSAVDDMWHAAVSGRGTYFSAGNPAELASGLRDALREIRVKVGAGAAAATSALSPVAGNNFAYVASFTTEKWTGNLEARAIDLTTGEVGLEPLHCVENVTSEFGSCSGTMASKVDAETDIRTIYTSGSDGLVSFTYDNLTSSQQAYFNASALSQWGELTTGQRAQATGSNLVNYLRGQHGFEMRSSNAVERQVFRARDAILGDLVESTPIYVQKPNFNYADPGFVSFKAAQESRGGTVLRRLERWDAACLQCGGPRRALGLRAQHGRPEHVAAGRSEL